MQTFRQEWRHDRRDFACIATDPEGIARETPFAARPEVSLGRQRVRSAHHRHLAVVEHPQDTDDSHLLDRGPHRWGHVAAPTGPQVGLRNACGRHRGEAIDTSAG